MQRPVWLGKYGKRKWKQVVAQQWPSGIVPDEALEPLSFYCEAYDDFRTALIDLRKDGNTCVSAQGSPYLNPAVTVKNQAIARMKQLGPVLGWAETKVSPAKGGGVAARKRK